MEKDRFLRWLLEKRRLALKAAHDTVSRCKRIESVLDQELENAAASQVAFDAALTGLRRAHPHRNDLLYAIRLYASFKNSKIDPKLWAFYGDSKKMRRRKNAAAERQP
jgi:hypothetical protein